MDRRFEETFYKKDRGMTNEQMKTCSISLVVRKMQTKTT